MSVYNIAGIDYSIACPCLAISKKDYIDFNTTEFFYITKLVKYANDFDNIHGQIEFQSNSEEERYDKISDHFIKILLKYDVKQVAIEGYSYNSSGAVFNIAENTAILKHKCYKNNISIHLIPPTEAKKFATTRGNANKQDMYDSFLQQNSIDIKQIIGYTKDKIDNPLSDIIDSYYILKLLQTKIE